MTLADGERLRARGVAVDPQLVVDAFCFDEPVSQFCRILGQRIPLQIAAIAPDDATSGPCSVGEVLAGLRGSSTRAPQTFLANACTGN
jgi:hypothetical protein